MHLHQPSFLSDFRLAPRLPLFYLCLYFGISFGFASVSSAGIFFVWDPLPLNIWEHFCLEHIFAALDVTFLSDFGVGCLLSF